MRVFNSNIKAILASGKVSIFYLVSIQTPSQLILDTTLHYDINIPAIGTFNASAGLSIVEAPRLSTAVDREAYKITYADPMFEKRALFEAGLTGSRVTVYVAFINTLPYSIGGAAPGMPLVNVSDMIIAYSGYVDTQGYAMDPHEATVFAVIECASPMASLGLTRGFYTSKEAMSHINPADTSFDQVTINASKTTYLWGKI